MTDRTREVKRANRLRRLLRGTAGLGVAVGAAAVVLLYDYWSFIHRRAVPFHNPVEVTVQPGDSLRTVAHRLESAGVIRDSRWFEWRARRVGAQLDIKPGRYAFSPRQLPDEILQAIRKGRVETVPVVIPEGWRMVEIAAELERSRITGAEAFLDTASNPTLIAELGFDPDEVAFLEGYLFPDTYKLRIGSDPEEIVRAMVKQFRANFTPDLIEKARALGLTPHETVTLASIIEKETGRSSERRTISAVMHNRLRQGMRLQSDPTVIYGLPQFDGDLKRHHLREWSPYNTYRIEGLPPTPIGNPGRAGLEAAAHPDGSPYLYFVSRNDGTHVFSENYADHQVAVHRYQRAIDSADRPMGPEAFDPLRAPLDDPELEAILNPPALGNELALPEEFSGDPASPTP